MGPRHYSRGNKSDASKFTQNLLKEMIENIIFDDDIPMEDKYNCLVKTVKNSRESFEIN